MKEIEGIADIVVKGGNNNTVTIVRSEKPTHNQSRVIKSKEIVVNYFSDAEIAHLRGIGISSVIREIPTGRWTSVFERVIHNFIEKKCK